MRKTPLSPFSVPVHGYDRGLTHTKDICGRILDTYAHRVPSSQVHPVQRPLHIGEART